MKSESTKLRGHPLFFILFEGHLTEKKVMIICQNNYSRSPLYFHGQGTGFFLF